MFSEFLDWILDRKYCPNDRTLLVEKPSEYDPAHPLGQGERTNPLLCRKCGYVGF